MVGTAIIAAHAANFLETSLCEMEISEKFASSTIKPHQSACHIN